MYLKRELLNSYVCMVLPPKCVQKHFFSNMIMIPYDYNTEHISNYLEANCLQLDDVDHRC